MSVRKMISVILVACLFISLAAAPVFAAPVSKVDPNDGGKYYKVKSGDVLWKIAKANNLALKDIIALNTEIKNPNLIYVDQMVRIAAKVAPAVAVYYPNGTYRGSYIDSGNEQVGVQITVADGKIMALAYSQLYFNKIDYLKSTDAKPVNIKNQYDQVVAYVKDKAIATAISDLYTPGNFVKDVGTGVDAVTGATLRTVKVISAMNDALNRGVYKPVDTASVNRPLAAATYDNGVYRGSYISKDKQEVGIQFELVDNKVQTISYVNLAHNDVNYLTATEGNTKNLLTQYNQLIDYLKGQDIRTALKGFYTPGNIVTNLGTANVDAVSGATLRSAKVLSAINDGLNKGVYTDKKQFDTTNKLYGKAYPDGTYRGTFYFNGFQQVGVEFTLKSNKIETIKYKKLFYKEKDYLTEKEDVKVLAWAKQYNQLLEYMIGKDVSKTVDLYTKTMVKDEKAGVDTVSGATIRASKVVYSIADALLRGPYKK